MPSQDLPCPTVSFEFFPPGTEPGRERLLALATELAGFDPAFVSVTYGAGGTNQDRTLSVVAELAAALPVPVAGHLTTVGATKEDIHTVVDRYADSGVEHIVALRGDAPEDGSVAETTDVGGYESAAELVTGIRSRPDGDRFEISVAAYPEVHPKATSPEADLDNLKQKLDAGADRAITQFFFDPEAFLRFRDRAEAAGIDAPLVPGIMPITNYAGMARFAERCGTTIPRSLTTLLADLDDDPDVQLPVAATVAAEQCQRLAAEGVDTFHLYTMNRRQLPTATCRSLGLRPTLELGTELTR
ncbi:MAG: methylenetetrahydrofolate reductase [NAD(P)H] [Acidimicrobiales bacterium]